MSIDQKIDYVEFPGDDFDAIEKFYSSSFGWSFTDYGADYRAFSDQRLDGGFYKSTLRSRASSGAALVVLFATELEQARDRIVDNGGTINKEIFAFPGGRRFHFLDVHGNELAVWSDA